MGLIDSFPEVGNVVKVGSAVVNAFNKLMDNTDIRQRFKTTGVVKGSVTIYDYRVAFIVEDMKRRAIEAEVVPSND